jgi:hypothetical protein
MDRRRRINPYRFYVRKYVDYAKAQASVDLNRSEQPWMDLRYGEVLLNRAEAAMELGNTSDALASVNQIRVAGRRYALWFYRPGKSA